MKSLNFTAIQFKKGENMDDKNAVKVGGIKVTDWEQILEQKTFAHTVETTCVLDVPNGWIYRYTDSEGRNTMVFVPDIVKASASVDIPDTLSVRKHEY